MITDMKKRSSLIASICFCVYAIYVCICRIKSVSESSYDYIRFPDIINWVILFGFAIALFFKKKNITFVIVAGMNMLLHIYYMINSYFVYVIDLQCIVDFLAAVVLILIVAISCIPLKSKKIVVSKIMYLMPAILQLLFYVINWNRHGMFLKFNESWIYIIFNLLEVAGYYFLGVWLHTDDDVTS